MRGVSWLAIAAALAACGSHSPAPIVYGTAPTTTGRVYRAPEDYDRINETAPQRRAVAFMPSPTRALSRPIVDAEAAETLINASIEEDELPPAPTYISLQETPHEARGGEGTTIVQPGDTVYAIARRTGASPQAIIAENGLRPPYGLEIGETIRLPAPERKIANRITAPAPARPETRASRETERTIRRGDTLYSISRSTGVSVEALARANRLARPYTLEVGDALNIPTSRGRKAPPVRREAKAVIETPTEDVGELARSVSYSAPETKAPRLFEWPIKGAILSEYGAGTLGRRNDGVNIAAPVGTPVRAAADGEVVYRGSELDGYGNLLLIKHDEGYVTAYAHNDVMLVDKGQPVRQGQIVAKVGKSGSAEEPQLHFEIRQNLKPVDPLAFLRD